MVAVEWTGLRRALLRIARRYCVTEADAEDVVQLVLERLVKHGVEFSSPGLPPTGSYLRQMCLNAVRSDYRSRVRRLQRESEWMEVCEAADTPEDALVERASGAELFAALSTLSAAVPVGVAEAFRLCDVEGLSAPAAARRLGVPEGTVRTWLRRFRMGLEAAMRSADVPARIVVGVRAGRGDMRGATVTDQ